jgi:AraC family transcriptional regulator
MNLKIKVTELPEMNLAAVMSLGIANVEASFNVLMDWARTRNLFSAEHVKMISVYHDSFKVTSPEKVRIHACMLLEEALKTHEGEVFSETIEAGKFIVGSGEVTLNDFEQCWVSLFLWMKENQYPFVKLFRLRCTILILKSIPKEKWSSISVFLSVNSKTYDSDLKKYGSAIKIYSRYNFVLLLN